MPDLDYDKLYKWTVTIESDSVQPVKFVYVQTYGSIRTWLDRRYPYPLPLEIVTLDENNEEWVAWRDSDGDWHSELDAYYESLEW